MFAVHETIGLRRCLIAAVSDIELLAALEIFFLINLSLFVEFSYVESSVAQF